MRGKLVQAKQEQANEGVHQLLKTFDVVSFLGRHYILKSR